MHMTDSFDRGLMWHSQTDVPCILSVVNRVICIQWNFHIWHTVEHHDRCWCDGVLIFNFFNVISFHSSLIHHSNKEVSLNLLLETTDLFHVWTAWKEWPTCCLGRLSIRSCPNKIWSAFIFNYIFKLPVHRPPAVISWTPGSVDPWLKTFEITKLLFVSWRIISYGSKIFSHIQMLMRIVFIRTDESFPPRPPIFNVTLSLLQNYCNYAIMCQIGISWINTKPLLFFFTQ